MRVDFIIGRGRGWLSVRGDFVRKDPVTGAVASEAAAASDADADKVVAAARRAFPCMVGDGPERAARLAHESRRSS